MSNISVIIPVYNADLYINRCIDSIIKSKKYIYELILIDDGSTDDSANICKKYEKKYSFIKYIYQQNSGPSAARNMGLKMAKGKYIMFVDSDDYIDDLKSVVESLEKEDSDYYIFSKMHKLINKKSNITKINFNEKNYDVKCSQKVLKKLIRTEIINSPCSKIYNKQIIENNKIRFDKKYKMAEDLLFNIEYVKCCDTFRIINEGFYYYCFNDTESLTKRYHDNKYEMLMGVNKRLKPMFEKMNIQSIYDYLVYKNVYSCIKDLKHTDCKLNDNQKIETILKYQHEHKGKILFNYGIKMLLWSIAFNMLSAKMILKLIH